MRTVTLLTVLGDDVFSRLFDASGRRQIWLKRLTLLLLGLLAVACAAFATTVVKVPAPSPLPIAYERMTPLPFRTQVSRIKHKILNFIGARPATPATPASRPLTVAFYTSWSDNSAQALARHINQIDWVAPTLFTLGQDGQLITSDDGPLRRVIGGNLHHPLVLPVVQNIRNGAWDGPGAGALLHDSRRRAALIGQLSKALDRSGDNGVIYDFENLNPAAMADLVKLVAETRAVFARQHRLVSVTMPIDDLHWPARDLARAADRLILMGYDEHWQGGVPGPIASKAWFIRQLDLTLAGVDRSRIIVALGNYAYDWHDGRADALTVEEAWLAARDSGAKPVFDRQSGNLGFSYAENDKRHDIWFLDAATAWNQMQHLSRLGLPSMCGGCTIRFDPRTRVGQSDLDPGLCPCLGRHLADPRPRRGGRRARAERDGLILRIIPASEVPDWFERLKRISDQWLAAKGQVEKGFSLGSASFAYLRQFDIAIVTTLGASDDPLAFANIWTSGDGQELSVDLMRTAEAAPPGTMDFLLTALIDRARQQGFVRFCLGLAPMSGVRGGKLVPAWARLVGLLFSAGRVGYNFRGMRRYKEKFAPRWRSRYIGLPSGYGSVSSLLSVVDLINRAKPAEN